MPNRNLRHAQIENKNPALPSNFVAKINNLTILAQR